MKTLGLVSMVFLAAILVDCRFMPPKRQYIKEAKQQMIPVELLNTHWILETWDHRVPDCKLTMDFYEKGRFTFAWNDLKFEGDNLWYIVKGSTITFHTRPIEKIVWTTESHELEPDNFAMYLNNIKNYSLEESTLILTSADSTFVFRKL
jgi:hypothetical protein